MSTPTSITTERFAQMVDQFRSAKHTFETTSIGSAAANRAERVMERLVARAERGGFCTSFVAAVTK